MLEEKPRYTIEDLFNNLTISLREFSRVSGINEVTLARIRDGKTAYRSTANKMLDSFSVIYKRPFNLNNVTGISVQVNKRLGNKKPVGRPRKQPETNEQKNV